MLDGSGVVITSGEELAEVIREGAPRSAGRSACMRSATARTARRSTRSSRRATSGRRSGSAIGSSTRSASHRRTSAASRRSVSPAPSSSATRRPIATSPSASGPSTVDGAYAFRSLWDSGALVANGSDAPVEELDPLAGIRAGVLRTIDERPAWHPEQCLTIEEALARDDASTRPGSRATSAAAESSSPATSPTSSCSRATRSSARPTSSSRSRSSRRWSAAAGCTTRHPGTDAARTISSWPLARCSPSTRRRRARSPAPPRSSARSGRCSSSTTSRKGPRRFTELERSCAGISPRTLAERLRWLEAEEIVARQSYPESPPRVEYALTEQGPSAASGRARDAPLRPRLARLRRPRSGRLSRQRRFDARPADRAPSSRLRVVEGGLRQRSRRP